MTGGAARTLPIPSGAPVSMAMGAALLASAKAVGTASSATSVTLMTHLDEGRVGYTGLLHLVCVSLGRGDRDLPGGRAHSVLRPVHRLPWGRGTGTWSHGDVITWSDHHHMTTRSRRYMAQLVVDEARFRRSVPCFSFSQLVILISGYFEYSAYIKAAVGHI